MHQLLKKAIANAWPLIIASIAVLSVSGIFYLVGTKGFGFEKSGPIAALIGTLLTLAGTITGQTSGFTEVVVNEDGSHSYFDPDSKFNLHLISGIALLIIGTLLAIYGPAV